MPIFRLADLTPSIDPDAFIADTAIVVGNVHLAAGTSLWYGTVLRSEFDRIEIGEGSNVQDNAVMHTDFGFPATVGRGVTIGHSAIVHGATLGDGCLVGIHATVLNGAVVGESALVAAGALVREGQQIPPRVLVAGVPARVVRDLSDEEVKRLEINASHYVELAKRHRNDRTEL